jgi:hypothetical protein
MTTFPALSPTDRRFTPGSYPTRSLVTFSGKEARIRQSNVMVGSTVSLSFIGLTTSQVQSIITHFNGQLGSFTAFDLPSSVWGGLDDSTTFTLNGYLWRYRDSNPVTVDDLHHGGYNINVVLESVPIQGASVAGFTWYTVSTITPGSASVNSLPVTVYVSLQPGQFTVDGFNPIVYTTLIPGQAYESNSSDWIIGITFSPGAADTGDVSSYYSSLDTQLYSYFQWALIDWWGE